MSSIPYSLYTEGHFHVAMVISVASVQRFPMVEVLQSLTTNSWKQNVATRISIVMFVHRNHEGIIEQMQLTLTYIFAVQFVSQL